ncbi:hypothetical protein Tco_1055417 [Tanacetum coccineum]|uniref:Uncharacterized protein n=1 Tax=Tanacetum coccineum TaxID=301880 RepID=A0ABQ5H113_9ASTR
MHYEPMEHTFDNPSTTNNHLKPSHEATNFPVMERLMTWRSKLNDNKNRTLGRPILTLVKEGETEAQGRKTRDLDPLVSLVQELVTPSKTPSKTVNTSEEEQVKYISPTTLEAAAILTNSCGIEKFNAGSLDVNTGSDPVTTDSIREEQRKEGSSSVEAQSFSEEDWTLSEQSLSKWRSERRNQGTWKLTQLKKLNFEEVKAEFEKLVKQLDTYYSTIRGEVEEDKDDSQTETGKRRKQIARKGLHTDLDKDDSEDSDEASEKDNSTSGTKIPINHVPVAIKSPSIANYKIIKQGRKGVYQIVRENGTDMVYISFGAMLTDISRDDLTELYRIVMRKHGMNEPEDEFEKVLWEYLKNMFEEPLSTDSIWSLPGQQRLICWRYYDACRVHCLNLESVDIYMLIERKYPLSAEVCKAMLDKKLQGGKPDEDCYKLLKMMEKQAGIRK